MLEELKWLLTKQREYLAEKNKDLKIIVEARDLDEVEKNLKSRWCYRILLDNFDYQTTRKAVEIIGEQCLTESSGGINETTARAYAECV